MTMGNFSDSMGSIFLVVLPNGRPMYFGPFDRPPHDSRCLLDLLRRMGRVDRIFSDGFLAAQGRREASGAEGVDVPRVGGPRPGGVGLGLEGLL